MKATIAFAKKRCYMNAQTRQRFGVTPGNTYQVDGYAVRINKAPITVANLCELTGRKDLLFMDRAARENAGFAVGQIVDVAVGQPGCTVRSGIKIRSGSLADKLVNLKVGGWMVVTRSQGQSTVYSLAKKLGMKVKVRCGAVSDDKAEVQRIS